MATYLPIGQIETEEELRNHTGVSLIHFEICASLVGPHDAAAALHILRYGTTFVGDAQYRTYPEGPPISNFSRHMARVFNVLASLPLPHPNIRLSECIVGAPNAHALIDTFDVDVRGAVQHHNPKYRKVLKFQLVTTVRGQPISLMKCDPRVNDSRPVVDHNAGFDLREKEVIVADKAYVGVPRMLTPVKMVGMLCEQQATFNKWHQLVRSPAERATARLHACRVLRCRNFGETVLSDMIRVVVALDALTPPPPLAEFTATCDLSAAEEGGETGKGNGAAKSEQQAVLRFLSSHTVRPQGKATTIRERGSPAHKTFVLKHKLLLAECRVTKLQRSLCSCRKCVTLMKKRNARNAAKKGRDERRAARQNKASGAKRKCGKKPA